MKAYVRQCHTTVWKKNPISGHEWPEHTLIKRWEVGGICSQERYGSEKKAQEMADYMNKFYGEMK